jgi:hypothetical protein
MAYAAEAGTFRLADVFSKAFAIYGRRFAPFIVLTAIADIPQYLTSYLPDGGAINSFGIGRAVVSGLVYPACWLIASAAVMYGVVQELRGRSFSVIASLHIAVRRLLPMLGVAICTIILIGLAPILLLIVAGIKLAPVPTFIVLATVFIVPIPGLMVACMYYFVSMPTCIAEQTGVFRSMSRSAFLTKGHRWQVLGMFLLILLGGIVLRLIVRGVFASTGPIGLLVASQAMSAIAGAFNGVIVGVVYFQLRVAKEGVDIDKIASVFD